MIFWSSAVIPDAEQYRAIWLNQSCSCILFSEPANVGGSGTLVLEAMFPPGSLVSSPQRQVTSASKLAILLYAVERAPL